MLSTVARGSLIAALVSALTLGGCLDGEDRAEERSASEERLAKLGLVTGPPANLIDACEYIASQISVDLKAWYCPPIVPEGSVEIHPGTLKRQPRLGPFMDLRSESLPVIKDRIHHGHWVYYAGRSSSANEFRARLYRSSAVGGQPPPRNQSPHLVVRGIRADVITKEGPGLGIDKNHALVYWRFGNTNYVASMHGYKNAPIAKEVARGLIRQMVDCPARSVDDEPQICEWVFPAGRRSR